MKVFNLFVSRWNFDSSTCGGGLRWQFYPGNAGYNYKVRPVIVSLLQESSQLTISCPTQSAVSNGAFLQLASRLARYTGNQTYADWANRIYSWTENIGLIGSGYHVFDGTDDTINCTQINHIEWTYNAGLYIYSAAIMYNMTAGTDVGGMWQTRLTGLIQTSGKSVKHRSAHPIC